nr:ATP-dependent Clp protease proteolytic subunit [Kribbella sandramycini]
MSTKDDELRTYYFDTEVTTRSVSAAVKKLDDWAKESDAPIEIVLHSPGGLVDAGFWFVEEVRHIAKSHEVYTRAAGITASMAGLMLQAGTERIIGHESRLHLHPPSSGVWGNVHEIRETYEHLEETYSRMCELYASRGKLTADEIRAEVDSRCDWYLTPQEALDAGFADSIF